MTLGKLPGLQSRQTSMHPKKGALEIDIEHLILAFIATHNIDAAMAFHCDPR
jgi:hypothetical protein